MSIFDYAEQKEFEKELENLFEGKKRITNKKDLLDFLKKDIKRIESKPSNPIKDYSPNEYFSNYNKIQKELDDAYEKNAPQSVIDKLETELANLVTSDEKTTEGISVEEQLRIMYDRYIHPEKRHGMDEDDIISNMRSVVLMNGGRKDITDEELLDAAKDAYDSFIDLKKRKGYETENEIIDNDEIDESPKLMDRLLDEYEDLNENEIVETGKQTWILPGGGVGRKEVDDAIREQAYLANFDNTGTILSSTNINDAIIEIQSLSTNVVRVTSSDSPYNLQNENIKLFCFTNGGNIFVNLPNGVLGRNIRITNTGSDGNIVRIIPNGSEKLFGENIYFDLINGETINIYYENSDGWW